MNHYWLIIRIAAVSFIEIANNRQAYFIKYRFHRHFSQKHSDQTFLAGKSLFVKINLSMEQENNLNDLAPVAAVAVAATVTKPLNDEKPAFTRNVSIHDARANKIFGTMKATRIHPNARPKINIYEENGEQMHQMTKGVVKTVSLQLASKIARFMIFLSRI